MSSVTAQIERGQRGFGGFAQIFEENDNAGCFTYTLSHQKQIPRYPLNPRHPRSLTKDLNTYLFGEKY